eukprot:scaffold4939_cov121-Isochrysis_galbana.AAC.4
MPTCPVLTARSCAPRAGCGTHRPIPARTRPRAWSERARGPACGMCAAYMACAACGAPAVSAVSVASPIPGSPQSRASGRCRWQGWCVPWSAPLHQPRPRPQQPPELCPPEPLAMVATGRGKRSLDGCLGLLDAEPQVRKGAVTHAGYEHVNRQVLARNTPGAVQVVAAEEESQLVGLGPARRCERQQPNGELVAGERAAALDVEHVEYTLDDGAVVPARECELEGSLWQMLVISVVDGAAMHENGPQAAKVSERVRIYLRWRPAGPVAHHYRSRNGLFGSHRYNSQRVGPVTRLP